MKKREPSIHRMLNNRIMVFIVVLFMTQFVCVLMLFTDIYKEQKNITRNIATSTEEYFSGKISFLKSLQKQNLNSPFIRDFLSSDGQNAAAAQGIRDDVALFRNFFDDSLSVFLFDRNAELFSFPEKTPDFQQSLKECYIQYMQTGQKYFLINLTSFVNDYYFIYMEPIEIQNKERMETIRLGVSVAVIPVNILKLKNDMYIPENSSITLYEKSTGSEVVVKANEGDRNINYLLFHQRMQLSDWPFELEVSLVFQPFSSTMFGVAKIIIVETLLLLIMLLIFRASLRKNLVIPIQNITKYMQDYTFVAKNTLLPPSAGVEIHSIVNSINAMADNNRQLMKEIFTMQQIMYEKDIVAQESRMNMLKMQINPHFLYNTLDCIKGIALENDVSDIVSIVVSLASMLRYSLDYRTSVSIGDEIDIVKEYCGINQIRHPNMFEVIYDIDDDICKYRIEKFILQPIVENAIKHGFRRKKNCHLLIKAERKGDGIQFIIEDDGCGISQERLAKIREILNNNQVNGMGYSTENSIGLSNVDMRIKLQQGGAGLEIESEEGMYTRVTFFIPKEYPDFGADDTTNQQ